jgi:hypothetical protein
MDQMLLTTRNKLKKTATNLEKKLSKLVSKNQILKMKV